MFDDRFGAYYDTGQISGGPLTGSAPFSNNGDPLAHAILYSDNVVINNTLQSDAALEITQNGCLIVSCAAITIATGGLALEGYAAAGGAVTLRMGLIRAGWMAEDMALAEAGTYTGGAGTVYMASRGAPAGGKLAEVAGEALESAAAKRGVVAIDANTLIRAIEAGEGGAVDAALAGRQPLVAVTAAKEFLRKGDPAALRSWLSQRGGQIVASALEQDVAALQAQAQSMGRSLKPKDARVAASALREGVPVITRDKRFRNFLNAIGIGGEEF